VLHRDLKPSNVLVDAAGAPHVLDFGMAKLATGAAAAGDDPIASLTLSGDFVGTPAYASPEQVAGKPADVRSDVYALGVILYEILAGHSPYGALTSVRDVLDAVATREAPRPSLADPALDRDLDTIVAKALAKDRRDRYESAGALADDVRAHLAGLPIAAQPPTPLERSLRTLRRHKVAFAFAATVFALTVAFLIHALVAAQRLAKQRDAALLESRRAQKIQSFFLDTVLTSIDLKNPGRASNLDELLSNGVELAHLEFAAEPAIESAILRTIAELARSQGEHVRAAELMQRAHELNASLPDPDPSATALVTLGLGRVLAETEGPDRGIPLLESAIALMEAHPEIDRGLLGVTWSDLGLQQFRRGDLAAAERATLAGVDVLEQVHEGSGPHLGLVLSNLSRVYLFQGRTDDAERTARRALELLEASVAPDHPSIGQVHTLLGALLARRGDAAAEEHLRRGLDIQERAFGPDHPDVVTARRELDRVRGVTVPAGEDG
jgi:tetratricopeptide (TPR) repeat protein